MPAMIKAVRLCDAMNIRELKQPVIEIPQSKPLQIEQLPVTDPIEECCRHLAAEETSWEDMQDLMKERYAKHVISRFDTQTKAAKFLGIGSTYLSKILRDNKKQKGEDHEV
jgi:hypothetical protein